MINFENKYYPYKLFPITRLSARVSQKLSYVEIFWDESSLIEFKGSYIGPFLTHLWLQAVNLCNQALGQKSKFLWFGTRVRLPGYLHEKSITLGSCNIFLWFDRMFKIWKPPQGRLQIAKKHFYHFYLNSK